MLKKAIPFLLVSGLVLGACGNNGAVPKDNETPMEGMNDREQNWAPDVRDERRGGAELDGLEDDRNGNNGVIRDELNDDNNMVPRDETGLDERNNELNNR